MEVTDEALAREAKEGSVEAVGQLYDRHRIRILRFAWSRLGHQQLAEDVTAEVFTRMVKRLPDYQQLDLPFQAWLYRIARNLITDQYRREGRRPTVPLEQIQHELTMDHTEEANPMTLVDQKLTWEKVQQALQTIDETQQEVIVMRFSLGLSLQEVALSLNRTVGSVKTLQHRGLIALRTAMLTVGMGESS